MEAEKSDCGIVYWGVDHRSRLPILCANNLTLYTRLDPSAGAVSRISRRIFLSDENTP